MKRGFTLIEILVVLAVLSIMAGAIFPLTLSLINYQKKSQTQENMEEIKEGLLLYFKENSSFPDDLSKLVPDYVSLSFSEVQKDSWQQDYLYKYNDTNALLVSGGKDRTVNPDDYNDFPAEPKPGSHDLVVNVTAGQINKEKESITWEILELDAGLILKEYPSSAPLSVAGISGFEDTDDWGNPIVYQRLGDYIAKLYSYGSDRVDDGGSFQKDLVKIINWQTASSGSSGSSGDNGSQGKQGKGGGEGNKGGGKKGEKD